MKFRPSLTRTGFLLVFSALFIVLINRLSVWGGSLAVLSGVTPKHLLPLLLMAAALGTDAMSLSVGIGLRGVSRRDVVRVSSVIGLFHVVMPLIGVMGGYYFGMYAEGVARWVGAAIVAFIGIRMIWGALTDNPQSSGKWTLTGVPLLMLATGVSIDALSVGFSLGTFGYNIYTTALVFGIFSAAMTATGLLFGSKLGKIIGDRGEIVGGCILIVLAIHLLFEG